MLITYLVDNHDYYKFPITQQFSTHQMLQLLQILKSICLALPILHNKGSAKCLRLHDFHLFEIYNDRKKVLNNSSNTLPIKIVVTGATLAPVTYS